MSSRLLTMLCTTLASSLQRLSPHFAEAYAAERYDMFVNLLLATLGTSCTLDVFPTKVECAACLLLDLVEFMGQKQDCENHSDVVRRNTLQNLKDIFFDIKMILFFLHTCYNHQ
jgi:hypothetical protein